MKAHHIAIALAFSAGLFCGTWLIPWEHSELMAQNQVPVDEPRHDMDIIVAEGEIELTQALLKYANKLNDRLGNVLPPTFIKQLELKQGILRTYLVELKKDEPEIRNTLIKVADAELQLTRFKLDREKDVDRRELLEIAVDVAEKRLEQVKALPNHEEQQDWLIRQVGLDVLNVRLDVELLR